METSAGHEETSVAPGEQSLTRIEAFSGPLPPPAILAQYDALVPGTAARILETAEGQTRHRQSLERAAIEHDITQARRGLTYGFVVVCLCLVLSAAFVFTGHDQAGIAVVVTTLGTVAGTFIFGTQRRQAERREKRRMRADEPSRSARETD